MEILNKDVEKVIKEFGQYGESKQFIFNTDRQTVERIVISLLKKELGCRICSCRDITDDKQGDKKTGCPCIYNVKKVDEVRDCPCWLFVRK
jgi:ferredoxin-thioredoxin reductase catalytic subunit